MSDGVGHIGGLSVWQLVVLLIPLVFVSATLLRMNNLGMVERRDTVLTADKDGDAAEIQRSLSDLQHYVSGHMNTGLGNGVYLQSSYDRARDNALSNATDATNPNSAVYQQAAVECQSRFVGGVQSFRNDYVQCVIARVAALSPGTNVTTNAKLPQANDYHFDFVSPAWSPDFAGLFVGLSVLIGLLIVIKAIAYLVLRLVVSRAYRRA